MSKRPVKNTKIVCTLGPASNRPEVLDELIAAGMDVARLNFSHGSHEDHKKTYEAVRAASKRAGRPVAILQDLQGPKIRVGQLKDGPVAVEKGDSVIIAYGEEQTSADVIPTSYEAFADDVTVGDRILIDDGLIRLSVTEIDGPRVTCRVEVGGTIKDRKGINLPGVVVSAPALTEKDIQDLDFGTTLGIDFVGLSFVRSPDDVELARAELKKRGKDTPIISKIEKPQAVERLEAILDTTDGIMVARGDLGVEMGPEKVPLIQKQCIEAANRRGKLVITATQMLESMVESAFPTRAEASDVANAVLDQSDAVMLSAETATGKHPSLAVSTMSRIITEVEGSERYRRLMMAPLEMPVTSNAIAHAAAAAAHSLPEVTGVCCISSHGIAPTLLSDYRPDVPIYALTRDEQACTRLAAFWGVVPVSFDFEQGEGTEQVIERAEALLMERDWATRGDKVVITLAVPAGSGLHTNTLKIHKVDSQASMIELPPR